MLCVFRLWIQSKAVCTTAKNFLDEQESHLDEFISSKKGGVLSIASFTCHYLCSYLYRETRFKTYTSHIKQPYSTQYLSMDSVDILGARHEL